VLLVGWCGSASQRGCARILHGDRGAIAVPDLEVRILNFKIRILNFNILILNFKIRILISV
jgi:hypothetical protein